MDDWTTLGYITKLHGYKGNLVIKLTDYFEDYILDSESVFLEISNKAIPFFLERSALQKPKQIMVKFEDVDSEDDAKSYIGTPVIIKTSDLPKKETLAGYTLYDSQTGKAVGTIEEVMDIPNNPLAILTLEEEEVYIPLNKALVKAIDDANKTISVEIPEGLIEINL